VVGRGRGSRRHAEDRIGSFRQERPLSLAADRKRS